MQTALRLFVIACWIGVVIAAALGARTTIIASHADGYPATCAFGVLAICSMIAPYIAARAVQKIADEVRRR